jgi:murein hydrolase activator
LKNKLLNKLLFSLLFSFLMITSSVGQSKKQRKLETERQNILKEIKKINLLLSSNKSEKTSVISKIEEVDFKINISKKLVQINNEQANLLNREIKENEQKINILEKDLSVKKKNYADMVVKSYKNRASDSKLMFLFSSENFQQAYKRYNYMKQYERYQKKQADTIVSKTEKLAILNETLILKKEDKIELIKENKKAQKTLVAEKNKQQELIAELKKDEAKYKKEIAQKENENEKIDKQIEKLIKEAIARANKKNKIKKSSKGYALTPEAKALSNSFTANKGKLPWPVKTGKVILKFGTSRHPTLPNITRNSSGVKIITSPDSNVKVVFDGTVSEIQKIKGGNIAVFVLHGNYRTIYQNLKSLSVKKGQKVKTGTTIGKVAENNEGKSVFRFLIFKDDTKQNPASWIYKM